MVVIAGHCFFFLPKNILEILINALIYSTGSVKQSKSEIN